MQIGNDLIELPETGKLDFKESYGFMLDRPTDVEHKEWKNYVEGQWDEFRKDVIALSNGSLSSGAESALIVLGVREEGERREIVGTRSLAINRETLLKKLNSACSPSIPDIIIHRSQSEDDVCVLEIPFISQIVESIRPLIIYSLKTENGKKIAREKVRYSKHCVFYRSGDTTEIASLAEKDILEYNKSRTGEFFSRELIEEIRRNLKLLLYKNQKGHLISPVYAFNTLDGELTFKLDGETLISKQQESLMFVYSLSVSSFAKEYDHRMLERVYADPSFQRYVRKTYDHSDKFLKSILALRTRMAQIHNNKESITEGAMNMASIVSRDGKTKWVASKDVTMCATYVARASDICRLYIAILLYLDRQYHYLLNLELTPFYVVNSERDKLRSEDVPDELLEDFIQFEINRQANRS